MSDQLSFTSEVRCDCSTGQPRVDLDVAGVRYRGTVVHGAGGIMRDGEEAYRERIERMSRHGATLRLYLRYSGTDNRSYEERKGDHLDVEARDVRVLAYHPAAP